MARITLIVDGRPTAVNGLTIREISVISGFRHRRIRLRRKFFWVAGLARLRMKTQPHAKTGGFPAFMKRRQNRVSSAGLPPGLKGWLYEAPDGMQLVLWECAKGGFSKTHTHAYDEYAVVLSGWFKGTIRGRKVSMKPGDECHIPAGAPHDGRYSAGYRAIDAFGGPRVKRASPVNPTTRRALRK